MSYRNPWIKRRRHKKARIGEPRARYDPGLDLWWISCIECGEEKPETEFSPQANTTNGRHSYCKDCVRARKRLRRQKIKERKHELKKLLS